MFFFNEFFRLLHSKLQFRFKYDYVNIIDHEGAGDNIRSLLNVCYALKFRQFHVSEGGIFHGKYTHGFMSMFRVQGPQYITEGLFICLFVQGSICSICSEVNMFYTRQ